MFVMYLFFIWFWVFFRLPLWHNPLDCITFSFRLPHHYNKILASTLDPLLAAIPMCFIISVKRLSLSIHLFSASLATFRSQISSALLSRVHHTRGPRYDYGINCAHTLNPWPAGPAWREVWKLYHGSLEIDRARKTSRKQPPIR